VCGGEHQVSPNTQRQAVRLDDFLLRTPMETKLSVSASPESSRSILEQSESAQMGLVRVDEEGRVEVDEVESTRRKRARRDLQALQYEQE